jgi:hypothetical protein
MMFSSLLLHQRPSCPFMKIMRDITVDTCVTVMGHQYPRHLTAPDVYFRQDRGSNRCEPFIPHLLSVGTARAHVL